MSKVLEFKNKDAEMDRLDELQRKVADTVAVKLKEKLDSDVSVSYVNLGHEEGRAIHFYIYENRYDFKTVALKFIENDKFESCVEAYIEVVEEVLKTGDYSTYTATENERAITDIVDSHNPDSIKIINGDLYSEDLYCLQLELKYITSYKYDKEGKKLYLYENDNNGNCEYIISLETGSIKEFVDGKEWE